MPNTLAHIGIQGLITRSIDRTVDLKWICLAAIIPDIPWILRRIVKTIAIDIFPYDIKLYASIQASLICCLIFAVACSLLAKNARQVFWVLALGIFLHLVLDALQTKWANGVHLFAPLNWEQLNIGLFWPNSLVSYGLSLLGLGYLIYYWRESLSSGVVVRFRRSVQGGLSVFFFCCYLFLPLYFLSQAESTNSHFVQTLRYYENRTGKYIELDRVRYFPSPTSHVLTDLNEKILIEGVAVDVQQMISLQGHFTKSDTILVKSFHLHPAGIRDSLSIVGLGLVLILWTYPWLRAIGARYYSRQEN
ncbi:MAG: metal-dependent hydrolase [Gammaproteobacteria bacterium]|nr:metal-dependent hydrolase [Gammaproteobacteria bacterium]